MRGFIFVVFSSLILLSGTTVSADKVPEIAIDHVMFAVYNNPTLLERIQKQWQQYGSENVLKGKANPSYQAVYLKNRSFYIEYLSTSATEPYWSNAVYVVLPKKYWGYYENPAFVSDHFLIPHFGSGFQLVSPDYPHLNTTFSQNVAENNYTLLISEALAKKLRNLVGRPHRLPDSGLVRVDERLHHLHDMAVISENGRLIAPLLEANPLLRENL